MSSNTKRGFYYGWIVVAACFVMQAIPFGVAQNIQPQFIGYVVAGEGFSLTQFSLLFTIGTIIASIASPFIGQLFDKPKMSYRLLYTLGAVLAGGGFMLFGFSHQLWQFYGVAGIVQVGTSLISSIGVPVILNLWFKSKSGTALGIAFAGGGIGNVLLQQLAAHSLATNGYSYAYIFFGILSLVVGIPIAILFLRRPKEGEVEAYEAKQEVAKQARHTTQGASIWGYSLKELKNIPQFWLFGVGFILVGIYVSGMCVQFIAYFKALDFDASTLGNIGSTFALFSIIGNLGGGTLFDKIGLKRCLYLAGVLVVSCGICLLFAPQIPFLGFVFAACLGIAVFAYIIGPSYMTGRLFGTKFYGVILGVVNIFFAIGYAFGAVIFSMIVESFGGYQSAWIFMTIIAGGSYVLLVLAATYFLKRAQIREANI